MQIGCAGESAGLSEFALKHRCRGVREPSRQVSVNTPLNLFFDRGTTDRAARTPGSWSG